MEKAMENSTPWNTPEFWVGEANYLDEVRRQAVFPEKLEFLDTTLRDGEGAPGVVFTPDEKGFLAKKLDELGVHRIEVGLAGANHPDEFRGIRKVVEQDLNASIWAMARPTREEIDRIVACGIQAAFIVVSAGRPSVELGETTPEQVIESSISALSYVKEKGCRAVLFLGDGTRADPSFLRDLAGAVTERAKPESIVLADTRGVASPESYAYLVRVLKNACGLPIEVHCHNDFGLGVANALAGVFAGGSVVHTSVSGIGERCGNTPLEQFAMAMKVVYGQDPGLRLELLDEIAHLVARYSGVPISPTQPVIGEFNFVRVSGAYVQNLKKKATLIFPYAPEVVGRELSVWLGKVSNAASVEYKLEQIGVRATDEQVKVILERARDRAVKEKRVVKDDEFKAIVAEVVTSRAASI
jgi:isopropylmalate/homocitrate/citramalate synthase